MEERSYTKKHGEPANIMAALAALAADLNTAATEAELFDVVATAGRVILGSIRTSIALLQPCESELKLIALCGPGAPKINGSISVDSEDALAEVARSRRAVHVEDTSTLPPARQVAPNILSVTVVPMIIRGRLLGTLNCGFATTRPQQESVIDLHQRVAELIAAGVARLRLEGSQQRALTQAHSMAQRMRVLADLGQALGQVLNEDECLQTLSQFINSLLDTQHISYTHLLMGNRGRVTQLNYLPQEKSILRQDIPLLGSAVGASLAAGGSLQLKRSECNPQDLQLFFSKGGEQLSISPIQANGKNVGTLNIVSEYFSDEDSLVLTQIANHLGTALTRSRMVAQELQARQEAERARLAIESFLANISHEIRTPLNGVLGTAALLADSSLDEDQQYLVGTIQSCSETLLTLLNDVLDFQKAESGQLQMENVAYDLHVALKETLSIHQPSALKKQLKTQIRLSQNLPQWILGDPTRLRQVVSNLVSNAIKFTQEGSVSIDSYLSDQTIYIDVQDSGIGINQEASERIFKPFVQADASVTRKFGGTGLGLSICVKLTKAMGGGIQIVPHHGPGSLFRVTLPAQITKAPDKLQSGSLDLTFNDQYRVLLVEDNPVNRMVMQRMLRREGVLVSEATNGLEALELAEQLRFDLVFMDLQMPVMGGLEATQELLERHPTCPPVVALTANTGEEIQKKCLEAGMESFLSKPIRRKELQKLLLSKFREF